MNYLMDLSPAVQALTAGIFTCLMTAAGALVIFFTDGIKGFFTLAGSVSAGIMIAASFFSLLVPALEYQTFLPSPLLVSFGFILGGIFVLLSDLIMSGAGKFEGSKKQSRLLYAAVTLHNIPEGMAVGVAFASGNFFSALILAFGIGVQNFPEGLCVACPLRANGCSRRKSFFLSALSGAIEIPAAVLGAMAASIVSGLMPWALSFAAGAMIAVSVSELIPESIERNKPLALVGLIAGFALMMFLDTSLG